MNRFDKIIMVNIILCVLPCFALASEIKMGDLDIKSFRKEPFFAIIPISVSYIDGYSTIGGSVLGYHEEMDELKYNFISVDGKYYMEIFGPEVIRPFSIEVILNYRNNMARKKYTIDPEKITVKKKTKMYIVRPGDNLGKIAEKFKSLGGSHEFRVERFRKINKLKIDQVLEPGQHIIIPENNWKN